MPLTQEDIKRLQENAKDIRKTLVDIPVTAGGGQIGGMPGEQGAVGVEEIHAAGILRPGVGL